MLTLVEEKKGVGIGEVVDCSTFGLLQKLLRLIYVR